MGRRGRKGQITLFIIIGVILLFSTALVIYIRQQVQVARPLEVAPAVEQVPTELQPLQQFVSSCIQQVGTQAVQILGMHGGWIDTSGFSSNPLNPTEADALEFVPGVKVPYWWYLKSRMDCSGDCVLSSDNIPPLRGSSSRSIESQISKYVDSNIVSCLADFTPFVKEGYKITSQSNPSTQATIGDRAVYLTTTYPLQIVKGTNNYQMRTHVATLDVDLASPYNLATDIVMLEQNFTFFETGTLELLAAYSGLDTQKLPVFSYLEVASVPTVPTWPVSVAKDAFTMILSSQIPRFQVSGTQNFKQKEFSDSMEQKFYNDFIIPSFRNYQGIIANFYYSGWPIYFNINDASTVKPESIYLPIFPFIGLHNYVSVYDATYPIAVGLAEPSAFDGRGFNFMFALESNVRRNAPLHANTITLPLVSSSSPIFCAESQRLSGNVTVSAKDPCTKEPIDDVIVTFNCGDVSCNVGTTDKNGILKTTLPLCIGSSLKATKDGYFGEPARFDTSAGISGSTELDMYKKQTLSVDIKKLQINLHEAKKSQYDIEKERLSHALDSAPGGPLGSLVYPIPTFSQLGSAVGCEIGVGGCSNVDPVVRWFEFDRTPEPLLNSETAVINFKRISNAGEDNFDAVAMYQNGTVQGITDFVPGAYEVTGNLVLNHKIIIPPAVAASYPEHWYDVVITGSETTISTPEIDMQSFPRGGVKLDTQETYWKTPDCINDRGNLTVFLISAPDGFTVNDDGTTTPALRPSDLDLQNKISDYSLQYKNLLEPKLS